MIPGTIPVDPFREAFEQRRDRDGLTLSRLADELGWYRKRTGQRKNAGQMMADSQRVSRVLGITPFHDGRGHTSVRTALSYDLAVRLAEALDLDPRDVGI